LVTQEQRRVRDDSDDLMDALGELKAMEGRKREHDYSTPEFHQLADEVEDQAKHVFDLAIQERVDSDPVSRADVSVDETPPGSDV
jgi:hypothetical protein